MKIKIRYTNPICKLTRDGNMYDLRLAEDVNLQAPSIDNGNVKFDSRLTSLGVAIELPDYFEANVIPRSSLFGKTGLILANSVGEIDGPDDCNSGYIGNNDIWKANFIAFSQINLKAGTKVCQFRIRPTMNAPILVKLKWLFTNKVEFEEVAILHNKDRNGHGSTGGYL